MQEQREMQEQRVALPTDAQARKNVPMFSGLLKYFPDALAEVARVSKIGNDQHNPGKPLFWDRSKSQDELDALTRHLVDAGKIDSDGIRHSAKVAWRALANLQKELEAAEGTPEGPADEGSAVLKMMEQESWGHSGRCGCDFCFGMRARVESGTHPFERYHREGDTCSR